MKNIFYLQFDSKIVGQPLICSLIKENSIEVNILRGGIDARKGGFLVLEFSGSETAIENSIIFLKNKSVKVDKISSKINYDKDNCVHCGACTAVCFVGALSLDTERRLVFEPEKCIACGFCMKACPLKLYTYVF